MRTTPVHWLLGMALLLLLSVALLVAPRLGSPDPAPVAGSGGCLAAEAEPNNGVSATMALPPLCKDITFAGTLVEGDSDDLFRLKLAEAGMVIVRLSEILPQRDYDLYLYDSAQTMVAESRESGNLPESLAVPLAAGEYLLRVHPYQGWSDEPYILRWSVQELEEGTVPVTPITPVIGDTGSADGPADRSREGKENKEDKEDGKEDKEGKEEK